MIGIIGAMDIEIEGYLALLENKNEEHKGCFTFYTGKLCGQDVVISKCGIGKVCAAAGTTAMILSYTPSLIINTGVAGGLLADKGMRTGDIVIADGVIHHDVNVCNFGYEEGQLPGMPKEFICDKKASDELFTAAKEKLSINIFRGKVASGDVFVCSKEVSDSIKERFNAAACEMESASIGQTCFMMDTPFAIIRSISDCADDDATQTYDEFTEIAAKNAITLACSFLSAK